MISQADPEAEKKDEAEPADQAEVLCCRPLKCSGFFLSHLNFSVKSFMPLLPKQTAKEDEKDEEGMWEETFKSFVDSKPNGQLKLPQTDNVDDRYTCSALHDIFSSRSNSD